MIGVSAGGVQLIAGREEHLGAIGGHPVENDPAGRAGGEVDRVNESPTFM